MFLEHLGGGGGWNLEESSPRSPGSKLAPSYWWPHVSTEGETLALTWPDSISGGRRSTETRGTTASPGPSSGPWTRRRSSSSPAATWTTGWSSPGRNFLERTEGSITFTIKIQSLSAPAQTVTSLTKVNHLGVSPLLWDCFSHLHGAQRRGELPPGSPCL